MWLTVAELALRATGYASPLLFAADGDYEYFPAPNQETHRYDVRIRTNRFGMRSPDFDPATETRQRVLILGDSVIHGGNWTDQDALATSRLTDDTRLMLNVSAGHEGEPISHGMLNVRRSMSDVHILIPDFLMLTTVLILIIPCKWRQSPQAGYQ